MELGPDSLQNQSAQPAMPAPASGKTPFLQLWMRLLLSPSVKTFEQFLPEAALGRAVVWLLVTSVITSLLSFLPLALFGRRYWQTMPPEMLRELPIREIPFSLGSMLCGIPTGLVMGLLASFAIVGLFQLIAKLFQGQGTYTETFFLFAAVTAPLGIVAAAITLISALLAQIPYVGVVLQLLFGLISLAVSLYTVVLEAIGVAAAHRFSLGKGFASVLIPYALLFLVFCCLIGGIAAVIGASLGELMRQMPGNMFTPGP